jgi:flavin-dependent dehydrogenase
MDCDVAIIGGGPAGSTLGGFLKKYQPGLSVRIYESENFPRDHVGESQLPTISEYLYELGVWDKIEAANFPIKVGGTFKWGRSKELWHFSFLPTDLADTPRPAKFEGQRRLVAFQVDRAVYDKILLDHAKELGCDVFEGTRIQSVHRDGDRVSFLETATGEQVTARYYMDASGHRGVLRTAFDVECEYPTALKNVAFWGYWQNAEWPENIGTGGTRVQIMSLPYGWIWFIPISETRTSVGLVTPAEYYKESKMRPADLYDKALKEEPRISYLLTGAQYEGELSATKDWSFLSSKLYGDNWFLVGESAGFADPILSAGLTITQSCAREAAFTLIELGRGEHDPTWLRKEYERLQVNRIRSHIRFADYWYTANGQFEDLKEYTREIAKVNGLDLSANDAWRWLASGGFIDDDFAPGAATFNINGIRDLTEYLDPVKREHPFNTKNVFKLNLEGAEFTYRSRYEHGRVVKYECFERDGKILPMAGAYEVVVDVLQADSRIMEIAQHLRGILGQIPPPMAKRLKREFPIYLWAMLESGWIEASHDPSRPLLPFEVERLWAMDWHQDTKEALRQIAVADAMA